MMPNVRYSPGDGVELYCDDDGFDLLIRRLQVLRERGGHEHLMTPSWAGNELTEETQGDGMSLVHHVRIVLRPEQPTLRRE